MVSPIRQTSDMWPKRFCIVFSVLLGVGMLIPLIGWLLEIPGLIKLSGDSAPMRGNTVLSMLVISAVLVGLEIGYRKIVWLALFPVAIGILTLAQDLFALNFGIDDLFFRYFLPDGRINGARMTPPIASCLILAGISLATLLNSRTSQRKTLFLALVASAILSIGTATVLGYALKIDAVILWGFDSANSALSAWTMVILGAAILARAWRENSMADAGAPIWLPLPVVVGSATLTMILYVGLNNQEIVRLRETTGRNAEALAIGLNATMRNQATNLDYLARDWASTTRTDIVRGVDVATFLQKNVGGKMISLVSPAPESISLKTFPTEGNEHLAMFYHGREPPRSDAMTEAQTTPRGPAISGTIEIPISGPGYAIYAPLEIENITHFICVDFVFQQVIAQLINDNESLRRDFVCLLSIGSQQIFNNTGSSSIDAALQARGGLDVVFPIQERRVRFALVRTSAAFNRDRRNLPELAFAAGLGITLLLGLSVHFARTAYTSLRTAEISNRRLQTENEERRRVEAMLKVSDERLRLALDSTQIGIFEWNLPANQVYYSPGLWAMLDYTAGDIATTPEAWTELIHEDDLSAYREAINQQVSGVETFIAPEYRLRTGSGEWRWINARAKTVAREPNGAPFRIIGTLQDITDRKNAEEALKESQAAARKLSLVASRTDNLVIITSPLGRIEWVNESFTRVMEFDLKEIEGKLPESFLTGPESNHRTIRRIRAAMARGIGISSEIVNYSKSGRKYHLHLEVQPVRNENGEVETFIAILADITTRVETEAALRNAKAEADAASRTKSEFLASMSHEIRTPMNGVIGMTSLLMDTTLDPEQRDFANTIRSSGEALLTIINDILDFSKIESGKMELEHLPFDLPTCIEESLDLFAMQASSKQLDLAYHVEEGIPGWVMGDITRLRQIMINLVNNAVKFTPEGSITIEVKKRLRPMAASTDLRIFLEISVNDTGIGIPAERIDRLFKPFSQVDSSTTRKFGGTGLGLAICHHLSQLMGGGIEVRSVQGKGSSFIFTLLTEPAHSSNHEPLPTVPALLAGGTILGIEDNAVGQRRLHSFFKSWGVSYQGVTEGKTAWERLTEGKPPSFVILDQDVFLTPHGQQILAVIEARQLPTLFLSVPGRDSSRIIPQHKFIFTINKPLKTSTLIRGINSLFNANESKRTQTTPATKAPLLSAEFPLTVLLVEDNLVNQKVALRFLDRLGYTADAVLNGVLGVDAVENGEYDLVLMDLHMPEMDGFEASRTIRRTVPSHRQPKIIALTANALPGDREACLSAGMDDYISKPVKLHDLSAAIRRQFSTSPQSVMTKPVI
jgi:PAS domain S-box-containing protein